MAVDWDIDIWAWFCANFGLISGSALTLSFLGNAYLFKKFMDNNKSEEWYLNLLKEVEPLLVKIMNEEKFTKTEVKDAEKIRDIIKSKIRKDVR